MSESNKAYLQMPSSAKPDRATDKGTTHPDREWRLLDWKAGILSRVASAAPASSQAFARRRVESNNHMSFPPLLEA